MVLTHSGALQGLALPTIQVVADGLAQGWEESVLACWNMGTQIATQYDKPGDPPSRDCSLYLTIRNPFAEPRIHRALPGGFLELETYRQEVVDGIHDHWVVTDDPDTTKWKYGYHERIASYTVPGAEQPINQLQYVIDSLIAAPHTRRALAMTWKPWIDEFHEHAPCLQYLWFRIFEDQLITDCHIRSNDGYKAAYMNIYAFTDWQRMVAQEVSKGLGRHIYAGQYNHIVDSFHIYGSYFEEFKGFLQMMEARPDFADRTYRSDDPTFVAMTAESREQIAASLEREKGPFCLVYRANGDLFDEIGRMRKTDLIKALRAMIEVDGWKSSFLDKTDGTVEVSCCAPQGFGMRGDHEFYLAYRIVPEQEGE